MEEQLVSPGLYSSALEFEQLEFPQPQIVMPWLERLTSQSHALVYAWIRALSSYDYRDESALTHLDLLDIRVERSTFSFDGKEYSAAVFTPSELSRRRRELMAAQMPYQSLYPIDFYPGDLAPQSCMLCENILQAFDAEIDANPARQNLILGYRDCAVLPNRYPAELMHSLIVPANHDDYADRVLPQDDSIDPGAKILAVQPNKTRGAVVSHDFLETVISICDALRWGAIRNHVLDGMSIPAHDHFQTFPLGGFNFETAAEIVPDLPDDSTLQVVVPDTTPFDTLFVVSRDRRMLIEYASQLLEKLERNNEVFTILYLDGRLGISPRNAGPAIDKRMNIAAGVALHQFDPTDDLVMENIFRHVPLAGGFNWSRYL